VKKGRNRKKRWRRTTLKRKEIELEEEENN